MEAPTRYWLSFVASEPLGSIGASQQSSLGSSVKYLKEVIAEVSYSETVLASCFETKFSFC